MEEAVQGSEASADAAAPAAESAMSGTASAAGNYDAGALDNCRYRLTDLIPTRLWTLCVLGLAVLALIAGIQSLYAGVLLDPRVRLPAEAASALDLSFRGSLAGWLSSMLLAVAAAGAWLLFVLRRHRKDDYRGHYRIWIWAGAGLLFASVDACTGLHTIFAVLLTRLAGTPLHGSGAVWWLALYGLVLGALALRMLIEIRRCRLAMLSLLAAGLLYALAACVTFSVIRLDGGTLQRMLGSSLTLVAHASVLGAVVLYARYVYLDAQGKLVARTPRGTRRKARQGGSQRDRSAKSPDAGAAAKDASGGKRGRRQRVDAGHSAESSTNRRKSGKRDEAAESEPPTKEAVDDARRPSMSRPSSKDQGTAKSADEEPQADEADGEEPETAGLSKAERRRLRKLRRRQKQPDTD